MDMLLETVELDADEANEMLFKVNVEGHAVGPARVRLVCEVNDMAVMFPGRPSTDGLVQFIIPKNALREGKHHSMIEVLVDNKFFVPVEFNVELKKQVQVFAEAVKYVKPQPTELKVSAVPIVVKRQQPIQTTQQTQQQRSDTLAARFAVRKSSSRE